MTQIRIAEPDRERIRYHLGYLSVEPVISVSLGFPAGQQPLFMVELAMDRMIPAAIPRVLKLLDQLDCIERKMMCNLDDLRVQQAGELKLRNSNDEATGQDLLEREYMRWVKRLCDHMGCIPNPFSERYRAGGGTPINTPVQLSA